MVPRTIVQQSTHRGMAPTVNLELPDSLSLKPSTVHHKPKVFNPSRRSKSKKSKPKTLNPKIPENPEPQSIVGRRRFAATPRALQRHRLVHLFADGKAP